MIDPLLEQPGLRTSVINSLTEAGVLKSVNLIGGSSPQKIYELAAQKQMKWSLFFIDGDHERPHPLQDTVACHACASEDAMILFHDLASPDVAEGLDYLLENGWQTVVYQTMQIMGAAWRGNVQPVQHVPDPQVSWPSPAHLGRHPVSGH